LIYVSFLQFTDAGQFIELRPRYFYNFNHFSFHLMESNARRCVAGAELDWQNALFAV
jgi:hypothetical protein